VSERALLALTSCVEILTRFGHTRQPLILAPSQLTALLPRAGHQFGTSENSVTLAAPRPARDRGMMTHSDICTRQGTRLLRSYTRSPWYDRV
jgi:hypothetical protein